MANPSALFSRLTVYPSKHGYPATADRAASEVSAADEYDKAFEITRSGKTHRFDCF
jgi:hypothetical protein